MIFAIAIELILALAAPQQAQTPQQESKLVYLNMIAVDSHGDPVNDLTADDFQIDDAGKRQKIAFFQHRDARRVSDATQKGPAASLRPNEFSNRAGANPPQATVILFDVANIGFGSREEAFNELVRFLEPLETADDLYLYLLAFPDGRLYPVHAVAPGEAGTLDGAAPWTRQIKPLMDAAMNGVLRVMPPGGLPVAETSFYFPYKALDTLASDLSQIPGRKNIVWVTGGGPGSLGTWRPHAEALAQSGVAIYPVSQNTLVRGGLDEFAGLTGGRLNKGKDIGVALKQSRSDLRTNYQIGYFPPTQNWDGKFHKLRITCKRKGIRIQARTGYSASYSTSTENAETETRQALDSATSADSDAAEIGLRVTMSPDATDPQMKHFSLHIDANDIALARQAGQYTAQLRLAAIAYLGNGRNQDSRIIGLNPHYSALERDKVLGDGIDFNQDMKVESNVKQIRFIVFDRGSSAVGSITIPVNTSAHLR